MSFMQRVRSALTWNVRILRYVLLSLLSSQIGLTSCSTDDGEQLVQSESITCFEDFHIDSISLSSVLTTYEDKLNSLTGAHVLEDGSGAMIARAWLTEYAEETIDIQYFIFSLDNIGLIATDYIIQAAERGVKVRILVDDIMIDADVADILLFDAHPNIDVRIYNPGVNLGKNLLQKIKKLGLDFRGANQRMHNKTFIVDGTVAITGGRNIADEYFDFDHTYNFRDRDILLLGKGVKQIEKSFEEFWNDSLSVGIVELTPLNKSQVYTKDAFDKLHAYACDPLNFWPQIRTRIATFPNHLEELVKNGDVVWLDKLQFISDDPGKNASKSGLGGGGKTTDALISLVKNASSSIDIQTPYLVTSDDSKTLFKQAVDRGVKVRILTNSLASTDNVEAFSSYQTDRKELLRIGIELYEFRPDAKSRMNSMTSELVDSLLEPPIFGLHAKSMVIDNSTTVIGTFNLDPRSANLNTECIVIVESDVLTLSVLDGMNNDFNPENSWRVTEDYNPDLEVSKYKRIKTWTRKIIPKDIL